MKIINDHARFTSLYDATGGKAEDGGIEQRIHYDHLGKGKVDVVVEKVQNVKPILSMNELKRGLKQQGWHEKLGKQVADIPLLVVEKWKELHGFDLRKANLNDPAEKETFYRLLNSPEWSWCKTYAPEGSAKNVIYK